MLGGSIGNGGRAESSRQQSPGTRLRIAFLTDIITPYLAAVLEALGEQVDLTVLFCSRTGTRGLDWSVELPFHHEVIEGLAIRRRSLDATDYYLSPRIIAALRRVRPQAIVSGGFSVPTLYAVLYGRARGVPVIIHSDGTSDSESRLRPEQRVARQVLHRLASGCGGQQRPRRAALRGDRLPGRACISRPAYDPHRALLGDSRSGVQKRATDRCGSCPSGASSPARAATGCCAESHRHATWEPTSG